MEFTIVSKPSFTIIGIELKTTTQEGKNYTAIPQFWEKVLAEERIDEIPDRQRPDAVLGICCDFEPEGPFAYIIAAEVDAEASPPAGMVLRTFPDATYAVFTARGQMPASIQNTFRYIYREWLPTSDHRRTDAAEFEWYDARCQAEEEPEVDIYIPIVPPE